MQELYPPHSNEAYEFGQNTAVLWVYFIFAIAQAAKKDNVPHLYFLTREGEFFLRIWEQLSTNLSSGSSWPSASLLEVSRISTFGPAVVSELSGTLKQLFFIYRKQTLFTLLKSLNCYDSTVVRLLKQYSLDEHGPLKFLSSQSTLQDILQNKELTDYVLKSLQKNKKLLLQYLLKHRLSSVDRSKFAVVDIGWRGSIQENLSRVLDGKCQIIGYYFGLKRSVLPKQSNIIKRGIFFDQSKQKILKPLSLYQPWDIALVEMLTSSGRGSVKGYVLKDGDVLSLRPVNSSEQRSFYQFACFYQDGVFDGLEYWIQHINSGDIDMKKLTVEARKVYQKLCFNPPSFIKQAFVCYCYEDEYGLGESVNHWIQKRHSGITIKQVLIDLFTSCGRNQLKMFALAHKDIYSLDLCNNFSNLDRLAWKAVLSIVKGFYIYVLKR